MARVIADCRDFPSEENCTIAIFGTEEEVLAVFRRVRDQIKLVFEAYAAGYREKAKTS